MRILSKFAEAHQKQRSSPSWRSQAPLGRRLVDIGKFASHGEKAPENTLLPGESRYRLQTLAAQLLPGEAVTKCLRRVVPVRDVQGHEVCNHLVEARYSPDRQKAGYRNLQLCDSVWSCPICAARITEARRRELTKAVRIARAKGHFVVLVTYTLQHSENHTLQATKSAMVESHRALKSGRWYQGIKAEYGIFGSVRSMETTHGASGWHPHIHELVFLERRPTSAVIKRLGNEFRHQWLPMLQKRGFAASWARGVDVRTSDDAIADYVAKFGHEPVAVAPTWSLEHEVTKAPVKKAAAGGRTPFQLLADYGAGDVAAGDLFREYALTMKGSHQLEWSRGLRDRLGMDDEDPDEAVEDDVLQDSQLVVSMTASDWNSLLALPGRRNDIRRELLYVVETCEGDPYIVAAWLIDTAGIYPFMPDGHILPIGELAGPVAADDRGPPD